MREMQQRRTRSGGRSLLRWVHAACAGAAILAAGAAGAVNVQMAATTGAGTLCSGVVSGTADCSMVSLPGNNQVTVTWSLPATTTLNGYDFDVQWQANELTLVSASQLLPHTQAPNTIPFVVAPNPADPVNSSAVALSLIAYPTNTLFSMTFTLASTLPADCQPDVTWTPNGNGLAPGSAVLSNPAGASLDIGLVTVCSDGIDNDNDGKIDFDGGACAGVAVPTAPDPECGGTASRNTEVPGSGCGLTGLEAILAFPLLALRTRRRRRPA
jgi:hypothetical protein